MNRAERRRNKKNRKAPGRKQPITIHAIVGILESSAHLDTVAAEKRRTEAAESGISKGTIVWHGKEYEMVELPDAYSIGITLSAQILAGQAAELALKYAYESEHPNANKGAPGGHDLDVLFKQLSQDRKIKIEQDYAVRIRRHTSPPTEGWETVEEAFRSGRNYPVLFRYATEEGQEFHYMEPIFLREAICSVLASLGANVRWGASSS